MTGRLAGKRILVIEDEYFIASDFARALKNEDAVVIGPAGDLAKGVALAAGEPLDGAVLDINLDGTMSYSLADRLAEQQVPCLFVTGYEGAALPEKHRGAPRITKPAPVGVVVDALVGLVSDGRAR